jgi:thiol-disulfide isomerase/thioredoxin
VEKTVNYKNWTLPNLQTEKSDELRSLIKGKKLVMLVYFAPWCGNWKFEAPIAAKLYDKYKDQGFQVIGISEYAPRAVVKSYFGETGRDRIGGARGQSKNATLRLPSGVRGHT